MQNNNSIIKGVGIFFFIHLKKKSMYIARGGMNIMFLKKKKR